MTDRLPHAFAAPDALRWSDTGGIITGGAPIFGEEQERSANGGGAWVASCSGIRLETEADQRTWEALILGWSMGDTKVVVPRCAGKLKAVFARPLARVTHSDGTPFSDGTLYAGGHFGALAAPLALRDTTAQIILPEGAALLGGEPFTLVGNVYQERLYGVRRVLAVDVETNTYTVLFAKPAREAYPAGAEVDFGDPRCLMRARMADGTAWPEYDPAWHADVSMVFRETFRL
ncbi:hypothetical protein [Caulobacter hibisci]|uniref:Uncharacterized protein n=1 Tax=Caulobacter hibisci TaxID=2035993 RepID=A0ABS0SS06_9CAUL|nr:hypothetical protein [Caulobacter hibisci]MBI1682392.1 hypothetical protein [Caulobacter hibisci]